MSASRSGAADAGGSWLFSTDHRRIGASYIAVACFAVIVGALLATSSAAESAFPGRTLLDAHDYHLQISGHGLFMVLFFLLPAIPAGLGNLVLPLQLGANNVFRPRINRTALHLFVLGLVAVLTSVVLGGADTGWAFRATYSATGGWAVTLTTVAATLVTLSLLLTSFNIVGTIHQRRAAGQDWSRLPISAWALYLFSWVQILATPAAFAAYGMVLAFRGTDLPFVDAARGYGLAHTEMIFRFYATPVVWMAILPAVGVVTDVIAPLARRRPATAGFIVHTMAALAVLSFFAWGAGSVPGASGTETGVVASLASFLRFALALGIVFAWLMTLRGGAIRLEVPMLYALFAVVFLVFGSLAGLFTASPALGPYLRSSLFGTGQFHLFVVGTVVMAFLSGLHFWWPKLTGRVVPARLGAVGAWMLFLGLGTLSLMHLALGARGWVTRVYEQTPAAPGFAHLAFGGALIALLAVLLIAGNLARSAVRGEVASENPWRAAGLEWRATFPSAGRNFAMTPDGSSDPYDFD